MSKYLYGDNSNIIEGSVVECLIDYDDKFTKGKLYIVKSIVPKQVTDDKGCIDEFCSWDHFKLVQTAPGSEVKPDDDYIEINSLKILQVYKMYDEWVTGNSVHGKGPAEYHERKNIIKLLKLQAPARYNEFIGCKIRVTPNTIKAIAAKLTEYGLAPCSGGRKLVIDSNVQSYYIHDKYTGFSNIDDGDKFFNDHEYREIYWVNGDFSFENPTIKAEYHERKNIIKLLKQQSQTKRTEFIECKIRVTPGTVEAIAAKLDEYGLCNKPKCKITISDDVGSYFINNTYIGFNRNDKVGEKFFEEHRYKEVYWVDGDLSFEKPSIQFTYPMWFKWHNSPKVVKFTSIDCYEVVIPAEDTYAMGVGEIDSNALPHTEDQWVQVPEPIADYEYPLWVRHNTTGNIYKYVRLQTCIWECYNSRYEGTTPHTNNCFTQIPEPTPSHIPYEALQDIPKQTPIDCVSDANTPNIKDNTMETQITVAMTAKEYAKYNKSNSTPIRVKTDLELAKKHLTQWFNANGAAYQSARYQSSKSAEKELQRPDRIGWTYRTYTLSASETTDIPTKSLI